MEDERPIHPMKETEQNIDYISPDKLVTLTEAQLSKENIALNISNMIENPKWHLTFDSLVYFRCINKQNPSLLKTILPDLIKYLPKLSNSIRSGISKEAIILVGEILFNYINENTDTDFINIKQLLYILFQSATSNKKFIKEASLELIENGLIKNNKYFNLDIISIIIDLMKDKKSTVCDTCYNAFDKINELYNAKKEIYIKKCVKIIEYFENNLGKNNFDDLLVKLNRGDDIKKYENWVKLGSKKNTIQMSFKDFMKSKKNNKNMIEENN